MTAATTPETATGVGPDGLSLPQLRTHRSTLAADLMRVAYWQAVITCRAEQLRHHAAPAPNSVTVLDLLAAGAPTGFDLSPLEERPESPADVVAHLACLATLRAALTDRHTELESLLAAATAELVTRYRNNPALVLEGR